MIVSYMDDMIELKFMSHAMPPIADITWNIAQQRSELQLHLKTAQMLYLLCSVCFFYFFFSLLHFLFGILGLNPCQYPTTKKKPLDSCLYLIQHHNEFIKICSCGHMQISLFYIDILVVLKTIVI